MMRFFSSLVLVVSGCATSSAAPAPTPEVAGCPLPVPSYRADVEPVLRNKCFACHAGNGGAVEDLDLSTFEKVHGGRVVIEGKLRARAMPPAGRPQLTDPERRTILSWLGCNAPEN